MKTGLFSKTTIGDTSYGLYAPQPQYLDHVYRNRHDFFPVQKEFVYPHITHAIIVLQGTFCLTSHYCSFLDSQLVRLLMTFVL